MEKVVVPQFVADWYKECEAESLYSTLSYFLNGIKSTEELEKWAETCEGESAYPKVNAEKKIAEMHLYGYEVEEEKEYYWRKKKEHTFDLEQRRPSYFINLDTDNGIVFFDDTEECSSYRTKFAEEEIKRLLSEGDFNKLERVEIDDVQ
ncbi:DUF1642 domain-containing protein [Vagococcus lutrae]|uniref:DUF1642 domain-containing protein n=1 Tax=Vagococcus lutrae TaxID=81947 RepID=UPI00288C8B38|nr:DUF1642 domain-containing protein [Vagococcus lutrae]MDT2844692.1 DUF1642 domain-containing protein [Vagococcus lutrae]